MKCVMNIRNKLPTMPHVVRTIERLVAEKFISWHCQSWKFWITQLHVSVIGWSLHIDGTFLSLLQLILMSQDPGSCRTSNKTGCSAQHVTVVH